METVSVITSDRASEGLLVEIRDLLLEAFDGAFSDDDWTHTLGGWHALVTTGARLVAHAAVVARPIEIGDRTFAAGYVEGVGTSPDVQGLGHGSAVVRAIMDVVRRHFEVGVLSTGRESFYERLGWEPWRGPTFVLRDGTYLRTDEDDDGIMAYRFGPSLGVRLTDRMACGWRPGDNW